MKTLGGEPETIIQKHNNKSLTDLQPESANCNVNFVQFSLLRT